MRNNIIKPAFWAVLSTTLLLNPVLASDEENNPLYNHTHELAKFVGMTNEDFWENDDDAGEANPRSCARRNNNNPSKLLNCVTAEGVNNHLQAMMDIADANNGTRAAGSQGYNSSADYVRDQLLAAGYQVDTQDFEFTAFEDLGPSSLGQVSPVAISYAREDFVRMTQTGSGDVTAPVFAVDLDLGLGNSSTSGCQSSDFTGFPKGHIALVQRGACYFRTKAENAADAGAVGIIIFNQGNTAGADRNEARGGTLGADYSGRIPAVFSSYSRGVEWNETADLVMHISANVFREKKTTFNVIAESARGNADNVIMLGAHLDSVNEGAGINDNGSGSAALLETAIQMKRNNPNNKLRFAWWSAEESGLIGSSYYVDSLTDGEADQIKVYLNFDMVGSTNYVHFIYDGDGSAFGLEGPAGSAAVEKFFELFYSVQGHEFEGSEISFRSDYAGFFRRGMVFGGLFTGAEGVKTEEQQLAFGGVAGEAFDSCYHQSCDGINNVNLDVLGLNADALALSALLFSYSSAIIDAQQQAPVAAHARSASDNASVEHLIEKWGDEYVR